MPNPDSLVHRLRRKSSSPSLANAESGTPSSGPAPGTKPRNPEPGTQQYATWSATTSKLQALIQTCQNATSFGPNKSAGTNVILRNAALQIVNDVGAARDKEWEAEVQSLTEQVKQLQSEQESNLCPQDASGVFSLTFSDDDTIASLSRPTSVSQHSRGRGGQSTVAAQTDPVLWSAGTADRSDPAEAKQVMDALLKSRQQLLGEVSSSRGTILQLAADVESLKHQLDAAEQQTGFGPSVNSGWRDGLDASEIPVFFEVKALDGFAAPQEGKGSQRGVTTPQSRSQVASGTQTPVVAVYQPEQDAERTRLVELGRAAEKQRRPEPEPPKPTPKPAAQEAKRVDLLSPNVTLDELTVELQHLRKEHSHSMRIAKELEEAKGKIEELAAEHVGDKEKEIQRLRTILRFSQLKRDSDKLHETYGRLDQMEAALRRMKYAIEVNNADRSELRRLKMLEAHVRAALENDKPDGGTQVDNRKWLQQQIPPALLERTKGNNTRAGVASAAAVVASCSVEPAPANPSEEERGQEGPKSADKSVPVVSDQGGAPCDTQRRPSSSGSRPGGRSSFLVLGAKSPHPPPAGGGSVAPLATSVPSNSTRPAPSMEGDEVGGVPYNVIVQRMQQYQDKRRKEQEKKARDAAVAAAAQAAAQEEASKPLDFQARVQAALQGVPGMPRNSPRTASAGRKPRLGSAPPTRQVHAAQPVAAARKSPRLTDPPPTKDQPAGPPAVGRRFSFIAGRVMPV